MQPYFFPYIGYFQLVSAVDKFVVYDDVNYIKQGWIDRNRILVNGLDFTFKLPTIDSSSFLKINEIKLNNNKYILWYSKFMKTLEFNYKKAPYFSEISEVVEKILDDKCIFISELIYRSLIEVTNFLEIKTIFVESSTIYQNQEKKGKDRVLDTCLKERATSYINLIGGAELYSKEEFKNHTIELSFIKTKNIEYKQFNNEFVPNLSIIDILMFNSKEKIQEYLNQYELV